MRPVASIIVLAYGNRAASERCLETLAEALGEELGRSFELVLVDNDSPDDTGELFASWSDRAKVLAMPENRNFSGGCNAGAAAADGEVLVFLNNDTEVPAGVLEALAEQAREPGVGAAGLRLLYPDGTIQHGGVAHKEWQPGVILPLHLFHHEAGDLPLARATYDLDAVTGACLAIPSALFHELGGFDERYANGLEDIDLCLRIRTAGHRIVYRGDLHLIHHERLTRGANHDERANAAVFRDRWERLLGDDGDTLAALFGLCFGPMPPEFLRTPHPAGAAVVVAGRLRSAAPEAFEARALLAALAGAGLDVGASDWFPVWEAPVDGGATWKALARAIQRGPHPSAATIRVPGGRLWSLPAGAAAVARIASLPPAGADLDARWVWAASAALVDELAAGGFPRERIAWLPPAVPAGEPGPGGDGVLALLPAHDLNLAGVVLDALAPLEVPVRLLPNVAGPWVESLVAERLPRAEILPPTSEEGVVRELAATADAVCGSDGDAYERRLLISAGAGAAIVAAPGGPAATVLGDGCASPGADPVVLRAALERALADAQGREQRAALVRDTCAAPALAERLRELAEPLADRRRLPGLAPQPAPAPR